MNDAAENGAARAETRASFYRVFSFACHGLSLPDMIESLTDLQETRGVEIAPHIAESLAAWLDIARASTSEEVAQDFHDLFLVPAKKYVTPYESVYLDPPVESGFRGPKKINFGPSTLAVLRFYRSVGLAIGEDYKELPDFAGLELACMEYLCSKEAFCFRDGDSANFARFAAAQVRFHERHIGRWFSSLCDKIEQNASTRFHAQMARTMRSFLQSEKQVLGEVA
ncbi:MAG: hypothetical protein Fur0037_00850 [Planctomycetota bacterium]